MESVRVRAGNELDFVCCPQVHACMTNRNYRKWRPLGDVQTLGLFQNLIWQRNMRYRTCIMIACVIYPDAAGNLSVCFEYACCCTHVLGVVVGITKLHSLKQYIHFIWYGFAITYTWRRGYAKKPRWPNQHSGRIKRHVFFALRQFARVALRTTKFHSATDYNL